MLRLPHEVKMLFREWLEIHFPQSAAHVMARVADLRAGRLRRADPQRSAFACRRLGLDDRYDLRLETCLFQRPARPGPAAASGQMSLDF